jgi:diaphanous 1
LLIILQVLRDAIIELNEDFITEDQVGQLLEFAPSKEEIEILRDFTGEASSLGKAEQFFMEAIKVPNYASRLKAWRFKRRFAEKIADITPDIQAIALACSEVKASYRLVQVLELILALGNYLNGGNARGQAFGFKLEILTKLRDTRSGSAKYTLIHYLVHLIERLVPGLLQFYQDMVVYSTIKLI